MSVCELSSDESTVCRWKLDDFPTRFNDSIPGDRCASDLFCFNEPNCPTSTFRFYLEFYPHGHRNGANGDSALYIQLVDLGERLKTEFECKAWMETVDDQKTDVRIAQVKFAEKRSRGWNRFVTQDQMQTLGQHPAVFICFQLPRLVKVQRTAASAAILSLRWRIEDFASRLEKAKVGDLWKSDKLRLADFYDAEFCLSLYPKNNCSEDSNFCSLYFRTEDMGRNKSVVVSYEMWIQNEKGKRMHKHAAAYVFYKPMGWGRSKYLNLDELRRFAGHGQVFVCCNIRRMVKPASQT